MTSLSAEFSLRNAVKEMYDAVTSKGMLVVYFWSLAAIWVASGIIRENNSVVFGFVLGVAILFGALIYYEAVIPFFRFLNDWLLQGNERKDSFCKAYNRGKYSPGWTKSEPMERSELATLVIFLCILPLLSSFVILGNRPLVDRNEYAVIGSSVSPIDSPFLLSHPFKKVLWIDESQTVVAENMTATTKDGISVTANVEANLKLEADRDAILLYANKQIQIKEELTSRLQTAFTQVVGSHTIETLPSDLLILSHLIHQESLSLLDGIPLVWSGEFTVTKPKIIHK